MIKRILVALDASPRAPSVLEAAGEVAASFGAALTLFRALSIPPDFPPAAHVDHGDPLPQHLSKEAFHSLEGLAATLPKAVRVSASLVRVGQSWRTILEVADEVDADLIVVGSHGYYAIDRVLGTTAGKVANLARRNVLVVHEKAPARASQPPPRGSD
jgi:nucleotide-binding universal stress UspA family protein